MVRYIIALFGILLVGWSANSAQAQTQVMCGDRGEALVRLDKAYSEKPTAVGLASNGSVIELFTSRGGTFTMIMTRPNGISCMIVSGNNWEDLPTRLAGVKDFVKHQ